ncbi:hypothetical protein ACFOG5_00230 [Pedobacter fastidiosus]|uniref:hypothetical protein n=1 Tax=Pedobacter fastidiosus TaxID=2765361 RepID=UPI00360D6932
MKFVRVRDASTQDKPRTSICKRKKPIHQRSAEISSFIPKIRFIKTKIDVICSAIKSKEIVPSIYIKNTLECYAQPDYRISLWPVLHFSSRHRHYFCNRLPRLCLLSATLPVLLLAGANRACCGIGPFGSLGRDIRGI